MRNFSTPIAMLLACLGSAASHASAQVVHDPSYSLSVELTGLANPQGVDVDAAGNVYLSDSAHGEILKGVGGVYSPFITGIAVGEFFGLEIGPLAVHVAPDQSIWYGEGGRATGVEQIHHHAADGSLIQSLDATAMGGNWSGLTVDPVSGRVYASSANRDRVFVSDPTSTGYGPLTELINAGPAALISPTGLLLDGNTLYVGFYGPWNVDGQLATFNASTGELINAAFAAGMPGLTAVDRLADGRLLASQLGGEEGPGILWLIDPATGEKTELVTGLPGATGVAVAPDGTTIYLVDSGLANESSGRLLKLTLVPSPGALMAVLPVIVQGRRRRSWRA